MGLINKIVPLDHLMKYSLELMDSIVSKPTKAVEGIIKAINSFFSMNDKGYEIEIEMFDRCFGSKDFYEGTNAFIENRNPKFR